MQRLSLDFQKTRPRISISGWLILLIGISMAIYASLQFRTAELALTVAQEKTSHLERQLNRNNHNTYQTTKASPERQEEIHFASSVLNRLSLPWNDLFKTLVTSNHADKIALLSIQPDSSKHSIKINGEAKDFTALLFYIQQLEQDKTIHNVVLSNHEMGQKTDNNPIRFTLTANWEIQS